MLAGAAVAFVLTRDSDESSDLTMAQLESALLTAEEAGPGFEESTDESEGATEFDPPPECQDAISQFERTDDEGDNAEAEFERPDPDMQVTHSLEPLEDGDPDLDELESVLDRCGTIPFSDAESRGEVQFTPESIDGIGEDALALRIKFALQEPSPLELEGYGVYFFRDGVVTSMIALAGVDDELNPLPVDDDLVRQTAKKADEKLQRVADEG